MLLFLFETVSCHMRLVCTCFERNCKVLRESFKLYCMSGFVLLVTVSRHVSFLGRCFVRNCNALR